MRMRLYSLYERRQGETRWTRISGSSYTKPVAIRVYQSRLLDAALGGYIDDVGRLKELRLRPVKIESKEAR